MVVSSTSRLGGYGLGVIEAHLPESIHGQFNTKAGWIWAGVIDTCLRVFMVCSTPRLGGYGLGVIEAHLPESIHGGQFNTKAGWIWARCH